jgi:hypothetical protein
MKIERLNLPLAATLLALATAASAQAQTWETILPNAQWPAGDLSASTGAAGGRALLFSPPSLPLDVYMSTIDYNNGPTLWRLNPDQPGFPLDPAPEPLDGEPAGGCAWVPQLMRVPGAGMWEIGRYTKPLLLRRWMC